MPIERLLEWISQNTTGVIIMVAVAAVAFWWKRRG